VERAKQCLKIPASAGVARKEINEKFDELLAVTREVKEALDGQQASTAKPAKRTARKKTNA